MNKVRLQQKQGCQEVSSFSRHWPCLFPQHGPGMKHTSADRARPWQQRSRGPFPWRFRPRAVPLGRVPGHEPGAAPLADGDRWYEYPRYLFSNKSLDILGLCGQALDRLGVQWRFARWDMISVARKEAVARLDEFVGPKY